jgi:hypothetical protein
MDSCGFWKKTRSNLAFSTCSVSKVRNTRLRAVKRFSNPHGSSGGQLALGPGFSAVCLLAQLPCGCRQGLGCPRNTSAAPLRPVALRPCPLAITESQEVWQSAELGSFSTFCQWDAGSWVGLGGMLDKGVSNCWCSVEVSVPCRSEDQNLCLVD